MTSSVAAVGGFAVFPTEKDPYHYQVGFGNEFVSEALPGVIPYAQHFPQKNKYDLYTEQVTGSSLVAQRSDNLHARLYRIRPSVVHKGFTKLPNNPDLESNFSTSNAKVHINPSQLSWPPFDLPAESSKVDFIDGIKTLAGNGDPLSGGVAIHMYLANTSMDKKAFCNSDGDLLIVPQLGRLDIQTEFGKLMVRPSEICVIQRGLKFKVILPDGTSRGYIQELYGTHYKLPELGPLGSHGLANVREFESPVAAFDVDQTEWEIVFKLNGQLHLCKQDHTPFDVVAWTGNYVPYKYDLTKFVFVGSISKDHIDPSCFCVLTAPSKEPGIPIADFLMVTERWDVAEHTFRPPYYHRNCGTEFMGLICGSFDGRTDGFQPGGATCESSFTAHGMGPEVFEMVTAVPLPPMKIHGGTIAFSIEINPILAMTDYAINRGKVSYHVPEVWEGLKANFLNHIPEINATLEAAGRSKIIPVQ